MANMVRLAGQYTQQMPLAQSLCAWVEHWSVLTPFRRVPHAWRTHTSTARYKQIPLEKFKTIDIDGSSTLQLVLIDSIIMLIPQKQAFQYNFFNS